MQVRRVRVENAEFGVTGARREIGVCERAGNRRRSLGGNDGGTSKGHGKSAVHENTAVPDLALRLVRARRRQIEPETLCDANRQPGEHPALLRVVGALQVLPEEEEALDGLDGAALQQVEAHLQLGAAVEHLSGADALGWRNRGVEMAGDAEDRVDQADEAVFVLHGRLPRPQAVVLGCEIILVEERVEAVHQLPVDL